MIWIRFLNLIKILIIIDRFRNLKNSLLSKYKEVILKDLNHQVLDKSNLEKIALV
jgi:hypothetical protein